MFEEPFLTLSQLTRQVHDAIEVAFPSEFWVTAEVASFSRNGKGHCYLQLIEKEDDATLAKVQANLWASRTNILCEFEQVTGESLKAGMEVLLRARVRFHEVYGFSLEILGINAFYTLGDMARRKQETLKRLADEGLMERNGALPLPLVPQRIAVISSATAAGYQDFVHQLEHNAHGFRFAHALFPALMQGDGAEASLLEALRCVRERAEHFDVAVIIRGGGSTIDLSCFDGYALAVEIAACPLPVVTGIGHERDDSVADAVAHTRCKTPTAAAELLIDRAAEYEEQVLAAWEAVREGARKGLQTRREALDKVMLRLQVGMGRNVSEQQRKLESAANRCALSVKERVSKANARLAEMSVGLKAHPARLILREQDRTATAALELRLHARHALEKAQEQVRSAERDIQHLDPANVLRRGFSITRWQGRAVRGAQTVAPGEVLTTQVASGEITSRVE